MNTKEECLARLDETEKALAEHKWDQQVHEIDSSDLLWHTDLEPILETFGLPSPQYSGNKVVGLPDGWLPDTEESSEDYQEVFKKYKKLFDEIQTEFSKECEYFRLEAEADEKDMHADFFRIIGWRR